MSTARSALPPGTDIVQYLAGLPERDRARHVGVLGRGDMDALDEAWREWAHRGQKPPPGDWRVWVLMAGRGFGKTHAGAHWVAEAMRADGTLRVALVGATIEEARAVMVDGRSGLRAVLGGALEGWSPTRGLLKLGNGAEARLYSGANPEGLRGPEHHVAWCDELAKWRKPGETWDNLQLGLRLGAHPRALVTTTPRPGPVLRRIMAEPGCAVTGGRTGDNPHTPPAYKDNVRRLFAGTRLGAQELDGLLLPDGGALWTPEVLERCRVGVGSETDPNLVTPDMGPQQNRTSLGAPIRSPASFPPQEEAGPRIKSGVTEEGRSGGGGRWVRTVVGVDPPSGDGTCGIVACAVDGRGVGHVLADHSVAGRSPEGWARAVADAAAVHGATVVAERNQGGRMVESVLRAAEASLPLRLVHAADGKAARAEPVALLFEAGRVRLHGRCPSWRPSSSTSSRARPMGVRAAAPTARTRWSGR